MIEVYIAENILSKFSTNAICKTIYTVLACQYMKASRGNVRGKHTRDLLRALTIAAEDSNTLLAFMEDILTPTELDELLLRWQIVRELEHGTSQRKISEKLGVSIATITRGSRMLRNPKGGFKKVLSRIQLLP